MAGRLLGALLLCLTTGCTASAPSSSAADGSFLPLPDGRAGYAAFACCTPNSPCPGADCAENIAGPPDGKHLDLSRCAVLDLFTGSDHALGVTLHLGAPLAPDKLSGGLLVEVSNLGTDYVPGGSLNWLTRDNKDPCPPAVSGQQIVFEAWCRVNNPAYEVRHLRLTTKGLEAGALLVDAVELDTPPGPP